MKKLVLSAILVFSATLIFAGLGRAQTIELKLGHFMPPVHIQHQKNFEPFAENVAKLSGGNVTVKVYSGGTLGGPKQLYDACVNGITDISFVIPSYETGRFPRCSVFELPSLFDSAVHLTKTAYEVYDKFAEDFKDVKILYIYAPGMGQFLSATDPILSVADLKGRKVRAPNAEMTIALRTLGASPVGMPISELAISLQKGVIDGVLTPYSAMTDFKLFDFLKHVTEVNMYGTFMVVVMNKKKFESLPDVGKKAIEQASGKAWGLVAAKAYDQHDDDTLAKIRAEGRIRLHKMPKEELEKIDQLLSGMYAEWVDNVAKKGIAGKEILEAVRAAAKATR
jgi:TRAP-type C4-dicarboxylate transport system substrate-binding protein